MKKAFIAAALVGTMLLTGCSGVSQEEYDSLASEKSSLENEISDLREAKSKLESEKSKTADENSELQGKIAELEKKNEEDADLIRELQENNIPLEVVDILLLAFAHSEDELFSKQNLESLQQYIYSNMAVCHIINAPIYFPPKSYADIIKKQEENLNKTANVGASYYVALFKTYDSKNVACFWTDNKKSGWVWFDKDIKDAYEAL